MLEIETVAILGAGRPAVRTALLCSLAGLQVRLADERTEALEVAFRVLRHDVEQALADGLIGREERQRILDGVIFTPDLDDAVTGADLAFAAEPTVPAQARALLHRVAPVCRATAILATAADPAAVAEGLPQMGRVVGLALEDPDELLPRVTVRTGPATTDHARSRAAQFAERIDRAAGEHR
jgi:3-hydroxybutyryl-CoA dehydrogenase